jgi:hypothetical protein
MTYFTGHRYCGGIKKHNVIYETYAMRIKCQTLGKPTKLLNENLWGRG